VLLPSAPSTVAVVGLGYVGLPLLLAFAAKGWNCLGIDIDPAKVSALTEGRTYIKHIPADRIAEANAGGNFNATTDFSLIGTADAVILCVPTPLDHHLEPDLSYVRATLDAVVPHLKPGVTLSLESTTYPGTTEEEIVPRVFSRGLIPGETVHVVYSPEREDPGNPHFAATNIPKVVGGLTPACLKAGVALYKAAFDTVVPVSSCKVAELTKLLENIYRAVNIGLVNELKIVASAMDIDIWEVIRAASTKPFGFTPFYPGPGLGGHCIPIDPFYLTWKAREYGVHTRFIELAGQVNRAMPGYVVQQTMTALNDDGKPLKGSRILLLGLAYKPNIDDMRESPTFELMDRFRAMGAIVTYHDPHVPEIGPTREHAAWKGHQSQPWNDTTLRQQDAIVLATHHQAFDLQQLVNCAALVIDTRNALNGLTGSARVIKA
jgi:UDP-N-acetyl-D-glucosamine dehydrogenase